MRTQHRGLLALAATATLVSGTALASAPAALAAPSTARSTQSPQGTRAQSAPVSITLDGLPGTVTAGAAPVEFTATLRNSADHAVDATTGFTLADVNSGIKETQLKLEFQAPGSGQWKAALLGPGQQVGAVWELDTFATRISVPAKASVSYRLRLAVTAGAAGGTATAAFRAVVSDPTLPPEQRISNPFSEYARFTVLPAGGSNTPTPAPAPGPAELSVEGVPVSFTAGGQGRPFKLVVANHSGKDIRVQPEVTVQVEGPLPADAVRFEFLTPDGGWLPAIARQEDPAPGQLHFGLVTGDKEGDLVRLRDGASRTIEVRLAFTEDAPLGSASVQLTGHSLPEGSGLAATTSSRAVRFTVAAPSASGTPSAPPSPSASPAAPAPATPTAPAAASTPPAAAPVAPSQTTAAVVAAGQVTGAAPSQPAAAAAPAAAPVPVPEAGLASTGGGSSSAPMAITGAMAIGMGVGTLGVLVAKRRRQRAHRLVR
ncbi:hypothetical protein [Kitasatospora sp. NPDC059327]|uniref:hypothetical protein n=1 Tax=Kitasatospora sp. NPDC059327 TaxID=3346803 RepID=UPI003673E96B